MKLTRLLAVLICAGVTGAVPVCAGEGDVEAVSGATLDIEEIPVLQDQESTDVLVVWFSPNDTIRAAAAIAAGALDADLFEIRPEVPYTAEDLNYSDDSTRATTEQRDETARPAIASLPEDLAPYRTILLGYPIWWGQAPRILYTFLESVDLSGKTVIPFCTSASSSAGSSAVNLQNLTDDTVTWAEAKRLDNGSGADEIRDWAKSLMPEKEESGMQMRINDTSVNVVWEENESVAAIRELAGNENGLTVQMSMYGGFEQVGPIGSQIVSNDEQTVTGPGDIVLYSGDQIVVFYGSNSWSYTRLGHITDPDASALEELLGNGDVTITIEP